MAARKPSRAIRRKRKPSVDKAPLFAAHYKLLGFPVDELVSEYRFHPIRRWRFDWAHVASKVAVEIDGGTWTRGGGRHGHGLGHQKDTEKKNNAISMGWVVFSITPRMLKADPLTWCTMVNNAIRDRTGKGNP